MFLSVLSAVYSSGPIVVAEIPREFRGVWVATVDNIDWPSKRSLPVYQQKAELERIVSVASNNRLNAIIFQIRPAADAMYISPYEPWSEWLTGQQGVAPNPVWDPLEYIVEKAHAKGIEVHAWLNPYRAWHSIAKGTPSSDHITQTNPKSMVNFGRFKWMNPADPFVKSRTLNVIRDVVRRYDIDGVHIDDYFYPYPEKDGYGHQVNFDDEALYMAFLRSGGNLGKLDWRRDNVNAFIKDMYSLVKSEKKWVKVGISPFGIYRPGVPEGIVAGVDQYNDLSADCYRWLQNGWCDYMSPQLYWPIEQKPQAYAKLLSWWKNSARDGRHIWPGSYTSKIGEGKYWNSDQIARQVSESRRQNADGQVHFSMKAFLVNQGGLCDKLSKGVYQNRALIPGSNWLKTESIAAPKSVTIEQQSGDMYIRFSRPDEAVRRVTLIEKTGYQTRVVASVSTDTSRFHISKPDAGTEFGVVFADKAGNLSSVTMARR